MILVLATACARSGHGKIGAIPGQSLAQSGHGHICGGVWPGLLRARHQRVGERLAEQAEHSWHGGHRVHADSGCTYKAFLPINITGVAHRRLDESEQQRRAEQAEHR